MKNWLNKVFSIEYRFTALIAVSLVVVVAGFVLLYFRTGSIVVEHNIKVEDRTFFEAKQAMALSKYHECQDEVEKSYNMNWLKACSHDHEHKINNCLNAGAPQSVCETHFQFKEECELSPQDANRIETFRAQSKSECKDTYDIETKEIEHE